MAEMQNKDCIYDGRDVYVSPTKRKNAQTQRIK